MPKISKKFTFFEQTLKNIILLFPDIAVLDMNLQELKQLCCKAWENRDDMLQIDRFAKRVEGNKYF